MTTGRIDPARDPPAPAQAFHARAETPAVASKAPATVPAIMSETAGEIARAEALQQFGVRPPVVHQAEIALLLTSMGLPAPHPYGQWPFAEVAPNLHGWTVERPPREAP